MLVLTRKQGEQIRIGNDVVITVVRTKGKAVRLGIQAPGHVPVLRGEIAAAISGEELGRSAGAERDDEPWPWTNEASAQFQGGNAKLPSCAVSLQTGRGPLSQLVAARSLEEL